MDVNQQIVARRMACVVSDAVRNGYLRSRAARPIFDHIGSHYQAHEGGELRSYLKKMSKSLDLVTQTLPYQDPAACARDLKDSIRAQNAVRVIDSTRDLGLMLLQSVADSRSLLSEAGLYLAPPFGDDYKVMAKLVTDREMQGRLYGALALVMEAYPNFSLAGGLYIQSRNLDFDPHQSKDVVSALLDGTLLLRTPLDVETYEHLVRRALKMEMVGYRGSMIEAERLTIRLMELDPSPEVVQPANPVVAPVAEIDQVLRVIKDSKAKGNRQLSLPVLATVAALAGAALVAVTALGVHVSSRVKEKPVQATPVVEARQATQYQEVFMSEQAVSNVGASQPTADQDDNQREIKKTKKHRNRKNRYRKHEDAKPHDNGPFRPGSL